MAEGSGKVMRDTSERRRQITAMLKSRGSVQVVALSEQFNVSMQTIRKDLHYLEEHGIATRAYGGAISSDVVNVSAEPPIEAKRVSHIEEKERIGQLAASMIKPGDSVILDSGTTALQIARFLPDDEDITVVTNDFDVLSALAQKRKIKVVMLGGELRRKNMAFYGAQTVAALQELVFDKLFLGVDGFDVERGITTHHEPEAQLNRKMVESARQVIAVTDSSKFGKVCLHRIIDVSEVDMLITDNDAPDHVREAATRLGFALHIA
ncbi:DeoR family transcriptional regulator [Asticcacaulis sp. AC460]|uniref:transcriptional repressor AgaR n=1 Tax=Asticcacaulis sp. AC460 TaxID=1282360 RepID=UPI0003C40B4E|nr:transcriptional repressor AgaR [Asticcacaulis sp. AC460]ESQ91044.1 DeoR family transcriptional regulator [Asticcacaulis sp. AC460]